VNVTSPMRLVFPAMPTVLCIDDRTYGLACMREMLRANGYEVLLAESAHDAADLLLQNPVDAVLLDCHSSGDNCGEVLPVLEGLEPDIPIVMMSGYCSLPCRNLGRADACLQKGETSRALLRTLEIFLCARRYGLLRSVAA
jgi:CheY-like chemotaxis protein